MEIQQFYDSHLAHASYAIFSDGEVALVDPGRNPNPYLEFARDRAARIVAVFETHPHADFVSSHKEFIDQHNAKVYINPKVGVSYPFVPLEDGDEVPIGKALIRTLFTPGHSPDHNSYLAIDRRGKAKAVFTGDSLFIGDVGRPDLREHAGNMHELRDKLARMMFQTIQNVFKKLPDEVVVYPAHGAGSLCGKNMSDDTKSTIGKEKQYNWAFQVDNEDKFVELLLDGQPFIPKYFPYDVDLNGKGAPGYEESILAITRLPGNATLKSSIPIVDARPEEAFKRGHIPGSFNIQNLETEKFETWVGSIIGPDERFYVVAESERALEYANRRLAKIGYELLIEGELIPDESLLNEKDKLIDPDDFRQNRDNYTVVDIRSESEIEDTGSFIKGAINIPLHELRERAHELPLTKPIVVHCAGGYRSAIGASIIKAVTGYDRVFDLSVQVEEYKMAAVTQEN